MGLKPQPHTRGIATVSARLYVTRRYKDNPPKTNERYL